MIKSKSHKQDLLFHNVIFFSHNLGNINKKKSTVLLNNTYGNQYINECYYWKKKIFAMVRNIFQKDRVLFICQCNDPIKNRKERKKQVRWKPLKKINKISIDLVPLTVCESIFVAIFKDVHCICYLLRIYVVIVGAKVSEQCSHWKEHDWIRDHHHPKKRKIKCHSTVFSCF